MGATGLGIYFAMIAYTGFEVVVGVIWLALLLALMVFWQNQGMGLVCPFCGQAFFSPSHRGWGKYGPPDTCDHCGKAMPSLWSRGPA